MHRDAAFSAIRRALMRLLPDLAETVPVPRSRICAGYLKSIDERAAIREIDHPVDGRSAAPS